MNNNKPTISLFIPCLVDQVYPEIGIAMAKVLKHFEYDLHYNNQQTCCGQPAFNAGHRNEARKVASKFIKDFSNAEIIVGPSGSCVAMIRKYYPVLFENHYLYNNALHIGDKSFEFSEFVVKEGLINKISGNFKGNVGFHNSCHSYRELGIKEGPENILKQIKGFELKQPDGEPVCCGFGGLFSFKFDSIAATMAATRIEMFTSIGASTIVTNDPGCLMHMRQEAIDRKIDIRILHLAEFIADSIGL